MTQKQMKTFQQPLNQKQSRDAGFTLIEIMIVVVILGILASIIIPRIMGRPEEAKRVSATTQIKNIEAALKLYKLDNGYYPTTEQGLDALVKKPTTGRIPRNWKEKYLDRIPNDPWGNGYMYLSPGLHGSYDLFSYGADGIEGGDGNDADVANWEL